MLDYDFYKSKRVLVTGHTGFKGTWLCKMLVLLGADVCGYALNPKDTQILFGLSGVEKSIRSENGDIRDYENLKRVFDDFKPEIVIHLAAQPLVKDSYANPKYTYETNVIGTMNLMECIRLTPSVKSVLNVTTEKVYENKELPDVVIDESFPLDGYDPYSNSKSCSELITRTYRRSFFKERECAISTARTANALGGGDFSSNRIITDCIQAAIEKKDIIVRNKNSLRPYQYVLEPLTVYLEICEKQYKNQKYEGSYNVAPDNPTKTEKIVTIFCNQWGNGLKWVEKKDNGPYEASILQITNKKLKDIFDWHSKVNIEETIANIIRWTKVFIKDKNDIDDYMNSEIEEYWRKK